MPNESHGHDESQASGTDGAGVAVPEIQDGATSASGSVGLPARRRYSPPRLRSLGKVADLTFAGGTSPRLADATTSKKKG